MSKTGKRKRGRPPKKPLVLPEFKSDSEIKDYLIQMALKLNLELYENATKKNNIKNPTVSRAKTYQIKTAIESLKITSSLISSKQLDNLEKRFNSFEIGLVNNSEEAKIEFERLTEDFKEAKELKRSFI